MSYETSSFKVAFVSGAAQGIGKAVALRLADDGFNVAVNDVNTPAQSEKLIEVEREIRRKGRSSLVVSGDISDEEEVKSMIEKVVKELGSLDVMVANAGVCTFCPIVQLDVAEFDRIMRINARGTFLQYKYAAQQMVKQSRGGRIIGASSMSGKKGFPAIGAYGSSKFAIRALTQTLAQELRSSGITVNAYAPGAINTGIYSLPDDQEGADGSTAAAQVGFSLADLPVGDVEDVAGLVSYFASPASKFMTGQTITIDGGLVFD